MAERIQRGVGPATWRYQARVRVAAPATDVRARLPAAVTVEPNGPNYCVIQVGSDTPHMLTLYLGLLDADFEVLDAPELAAHLRATAERFGKRRARIEVRCVLNFGERQPRSGDFIESPAEVTRSRVI